MKKDLKSFTWGGIHSSMDISVGYASFSLERDNKTALIYDECYTEIEAIEILVAVLKSRKNEILL